MKVYNDPQPDQLHPALQKQLDSYRQQRRFDASRMALAKAQRLNQYMRSHGLQACVIGISGGIDSAVTLALTHLASQQADSPIKHISPLLMPIFHESTTRQAQTLELGRQCTERLGLEAQVVDLTTSHLTLSGEVERALGITGDPWARGQVAAYIRTPALYYATSLLTSQGLGAIVVGTTNRDEGAYLGYVGKASDGMVDVQLISDLHKSEIRALARYLDIPTAIQQAIPTGDMYDGRTDTEVFGAPYDFVELYLGYLERGRPEMELETEATQQFTELAARLEKLHRYNAHKYLSGTPSVHLELLPSGVPGGWQHRPWQPSNTTSNQRTSEPEYNQTHPTDNQVHKT